MGWNLPPPNVRERVNRVISGATGTGDIYTEAAQRYLRVLERFGGEIPTTGEGSSWYRDPASHFRLEGAARHSQHLLGLARDWQIHNAETRRRAIEALRGAGFTVETKSRGRVHAQVLSPAEFARLLPGFLEAGLFPR